MYRKLGTLLVPVLKTFHERERERERESCENVLLDDEKLFLDNEKVLLDDAKFLAHCPPTVMTGISVS